MSDTNDDARARHQRSLLHGAPRPPARRPVPGELLFECYSTSRRKFYRFELRERGQYGFEVQVFDPAEFLGICSRIENWRLRGRHISETHLRKGGALTATASSKSRNR